MSISNQTPNRGWPNNVCCDAAQICPTPGFEHVCAVCCCVWGPPCVNAACANIVFFLRLRFVVGWCLLLPVFLWLPRASLFCVFFSVVFALRRWLLGLGEGHQAFKSTKIAHTSWRISSLFFVYNVLTFSLGNTTSPPAHPGTPTQGFSETHRVFPLFSLVHPPWGSNSRPQG